MRESIIVHASDCFNDEFSAVSDRWWGKEIVKKEIIITSEADAETFIEEGYLCFEFCPGDEVGKRQIAIFDIPFFKTLTDEIFVPEVYIPESHCI